MLCLVAGAAAISGLTRPTTPETADTTSTTVPRVAAPSTTTTRPRPHIQALGPPIDWLFSNTFTDRRVVGAAARDDGIYLFTSSRARKGLDAWRTRGRASWSLLGTIAELFRPEGVLEAGAGFVAYGTDRLGQAVVWSSADGIAWDRHPLPVGDHAPSSVWFQAATTHGDLVVLAVVEWHDPVQAAVNRRYPGFMGWLFEDPAGETLVGISGPLGIGMAVRPEDLGVDPANLPETTGRLTIHSGRPEEGSWHRIVESETRGFLPLVHQLLPGPDGRIWMVGTTPKASTDGVTWEPIAQVPYPSLVHPWNGRYVRKGWDIYGNLRIEVSEDLRNWELMFQPSLTAFPWCCGSVERSETLFTGPGGIGFTGFDAHFATQDRGAVILARDGYRLDLAGGMHGPALFREDTMIAEYVPELADPDRPLFRVEDDTVVFLDPDTREDLVAFAIEEIEEHANAWADSYRMVPIRETHFLFFSPDGEGWTSHDVSGMVPLREEVRLLIGRDRILLMGDGPDGAVVWVGIPPGR